MLEFSKEINRFKLNCASCLKNRTRSAWLLQSVFFFFYKEVYLEKYGHKFFIWITFQ